MNHFLLLDVFGGCLMSSDGTPLHSLFVIFCAFDQLECCQVPNTAECSCKLHCVLLSPKRRTTQHRSSSSQGLNSLEAKDSAGQMCLATVSHGLLLDV